MTPLLSSGIGSVAFVSAFVIQRKQVPIGYVFFFFFFFFLCSVAVDKALTLSGRKRRKVRAREREKEREKIYPRSTSRLLRRPLTVAASFWVQDENDDDDNPSNKSIRTHHAPSMSYPSATLVIQLPITHHFELVLLSSCSSVPSSLGIGHLVIPATDFRSVSIHKNMAAVLLLLLLVCSGRQKSRKPSNTNSSRRVAV